MKQFVRMIAAVALMVAALATGAQALEGGPLRIVVGFPPGGASAARLVGDALRDKLGVTVIVENKTGAAGRVAAQAFRNTSAAENALMIGNPAINVVAPFVFKDAGYDPYTDFVPVSQVSRYEFGVAVGPAVPVHDIAQLIAWLKANPQQANFGVPATGSLPHFFALMLARAASVEAQVVGYRGSAPLLTDVMGGQVPVDIDTLDTLLPQHESGKLRILAIGGARRSSDAKDIPTLKEQGIDLVADGWNAFFAPATMPPAKVALLGRAVAEIVATPQMQAKFRAANMDPVSASAPETARMLDLYRAKWAPVIKAANLQQ
jgi:tripartite-type tricarboxylate transporter receptor subunit TctC